MNNKVQGVECIPYGWIAWGCQRWEIPLDQSYTALLYDCCRIHRLPMAPGHSAFVWLFHWFLPFLFQHEVPTARDKKVASFKYVHFLLQLYVKLTCSLYLPKKSLIVCCRALIFSPSGMLLKISATISIGLYCKRLQHFIVWNNINKQIHILTTAKLYTICDKVLCACVKLTNVCQMFSILVPDSSTFTSTSVEMIKSM